MRNNIFLTGDLQVGKSTIIDRVVDSLQVSIGGFKTHRYYKQGQLVGFYMISLNNDSKNKEQPFVGYCDNLSWTAVPDTFDHFGVSILEECLEQKPNLIIMDELGFFETEAYKFQKTVKKCLSSEIPVLGVLKKADTVFLNSIKERKDLILLTTTPENREDIAHKVHLLLEEILKQI